MSTTTLLTAEEYAPLATDIDAPTELVQGQLIVMTPPKPRHGQICGKMVRILGDFADQHELGHVLSNDSAVLTTHDPDTVRGADVAYYSYARVPKGPLPDGYLPVPPDLVIEVLSPDDRQSKVLAKVAEYLDVGVTVVCVLDPDAETVEIYRQQRPVQILSADNELTLSDLFTDFAVPVRRLFE